MRKQQLKAIDIFEQLQAGWFQHWLHQRMYKQHYQPEKVAEFDWGTIKLNMNYELHKFRIGIFTLAFSNHRFAMLLKTSGIFNSPVTSFNISYGFS